MMTDKALKNMKAMFQQAKINSVDNTDEQALQVAALYPDWNDYADGETLTEGTRLNYDAVLYKVLQTHQKQATWTPATAPTLFIPVPQASETGTLENPIVWVSGMVAEEGKYYTDEDIMYLCIESSGVSLYGQPKDLARYFQAVE